MPLSSLLSSSSSRESRPRLRSREASLESARDGGDRDLSSLVRLPFPTSPLRLSLGLLLLDEPEELDLESEPESESDSEEELELDEDEDEEEEMEVARLMVAARFEALLARMEAAVPSL